MAGKNKTPLIGWHSADPALKPWIEAEAERRETTASAVLDEALAEYRVRRETGSVMKTVAATVVQVVPTSSSDIEMLVIQEDGHGVNWGWDAPPRVFRVGQEVSVLLLDKRVIEVRAGRTAGREQDAGSKP